MRTAIFIVCGFALWGLCSAVARLFFGTSPSAPAWATVPFIVLWFFIAGGNLLIGVTKAGYTLAEELPIFLLIFGLPAVVAALVKWKWLDAS